MRICQPGIKLLERRLVLSGLIGTGNRNCRRRRSGTKRDHIDAGRGPSIIGSSGFSVGTWVRTSATTNQVLIQQRSMREVNGQYPLRLTSSGRARFWTFGAFAFGAAVVSTQTVCLD